MYKESFHNTIKISGPQLDLFERKAKTQEEMILFFFKRNPHRSFTPFEVSRHAGLNAPITSIRRAMSNLTDQGRLIKTPATRQEQYGKPNYCWRYYS